ncbi:MAG: IS1595 family transposase, partial [Mesorhizobium sp.]
ALHISDTERSEDLLRMARDKRLTYRRIGEASHT